jgi:ketosteroid isomerase-like protein
MTDIKTQTVQEIYEAFGRGDVDVILDRLTDDVDWASEAASTVAPWHGIHRGKGEVPNFFKALGEAIDVTEFTPLAFASNDTDVLVVIRFGMQARSTGKTGAMDLHHWWRFRDGKVCFYRGTEDTALTASLLAD